MDTPGLNESDGCQFTLAEGVQMGFRRIPAGTFRMGARGFRSKEEPAEWMKLPEDYWLSETPVTQEQFAVWTQAEKIQHRNHFTDRPRKEYPAENLDWRQANSYCAWLSRVIPQQSGNRLPSGYTLFCLPTETEWEYACRAGSDTDYHTGDGPTALAEAGWFGQDPSSGSTQPLKKKLPNAFLLYDLHGNVNEWCHDVWDLEAYRRRCPGELDPVQAVRRADWNSGLSRFLNEGHKRVFRGGSWIDDAVHCRSSYRRKRGADERSSVQGFRVCLIRG